MKVLIEELDGLKWDERCRRRDPSLVEVKVEVDGGNG